MCGNSGTPVEQLKPVRDMQVFCIPADVLDSELTPSMRSLLKTLSHFVGVFHVSEKVVTVNKTRSSLEQKGRISHDAALEILKANILQEFLMPGKE